MIHNYVPSGSSISWAPCLIEVRSSDDDELVH